VLLVADHPHPVGHLDVDGQADARRSIRALGENAPARPIFLQASRSFAGAVGMRIGNGRDALSFLHVLVFLCFSRQGGEWSMCWPVIQIGLGMEIAKL
jgi:hypothetical protein